MPVANGDDLNRLKQAHGPGLALAHLVDAGLDRLPFPGSGQTLARWRRLSAVAAHDLSLVKLFEGHTDALAILRELGGPAPARGTRWGTWCAEPPDARVAFATRGEQRDIRISGTKAWCSGAASVTHAVISGWNEAGEPCLAAVAMEQPGVHVTQVGWQAVGMAACDSVDVQFEAAHAVLLGSPGDYTRRPGFWHGGAGIAACWYGGAMGIANTARELSAGNRDPHRLAHLGAIDVALAGAAALLEQAASAIDAQPKANAETLALRTRLAVEAAAENVLHHAARALGAGPLCRNRRFAQAMADLPVFMRQSHAERDLAALGQRVIQPDHFSWCL
ncbi:acyl-CoA dehydrogenase [Variovorax sp. J22R133]|uniref:acyl-CoA dehydrogenase n=1 Tax=Variovorax brevis TaxID=3053503 RepID=UPI0025783FCB|nr:acyl-CoA dehydrogenase [Variovorax sp. J22R133]MDM0114040.1 acyl-CoA dehydrogenase [Variovorax sp. J22R133]